MKRVIETSKAPKAIGPYSQAIEVDNTLYCSGMIPIDPESGDVVFGEIKIQTAQVLKNIDALLNAAGYSKEDVVKTTCLLSDISYFAEFNEVYGEYFTNKPARSCFAVKDLPRGVDLEIEVIAHKD